MTHPKVDYPTFILGMNAWEVQGSPVVKLFAKRVRFYLIFGPIFFCLKMRSDLGPNLEIEGLQCSCFFKRTYVDKNTDLIRTYFFFKYRPNTDPILDHLKKMQTSAALYSVHRCRL